jgi:hypothetical protein
MKNLLMCLILMCAVSVWASAQDSGTKSKASTRTITGCLAKGDSADEFHLTGNDGSTWDLSSDSVSLADHVGHTVSVTGAVENSSMHNMKEDAKDAAHDAGMKKDNSESGHLKVTKVKMVSSSCS